MPQQAQPPRWREAVCTMNETNKPKPGRCPLGWAAACCSVPRRKPQLPAVPPPQYHHAMLYPEGWGRAARWLLEMVGGEQPCFGNGAGAHDDCSLPVLLSPAPGRSWLPPLGVRLALGWATRTGATGATRSVGVVDSVTCRPAWGMQGGARRGQLGLEATVGRG